MPRRPGDPAVLVASSGAARRDLGWQPRHGLRDCVVHALAWARRA
jgi:UDP-glucose 4-epimerase